MCIKQSVLYEFPITIGVYLIIKRFAVIGFP